MSGPIAARPAPGVPRSYEFPPFSRTRLSNGLTLITVDLPGRPLVSAALVFPVGAADEPAKLGGATVLAASALTEGTQRYDAVGLTEAAERLGASLQGDAGWDALTIGVDVAAVRLAPALELLAEVALRPTFPAREVDRLRDERLNDILQAHADPRRRADEALIDAVYSTGSPYHRPAGGLDRTVRSLDRTALERVYRRGLDPSRLTLVVGGDLGGQDVRAVAERQLGGWRGSTGTGSPPAIVAEPAATTRIVRIVDRPGSVQTELRVGHVGLSRRTPAYHAISVMSTILGGMFASRLNMKLREEKGYTYGAGAGFDLRRGRGPFVARAGVERDVTAPALSDLLAELERMREAPVTDEELRMARDYLVGVFPLRFETPGPVVGSIAGLVVQGLPDDELARYRPGIEAVTAADVLAAAREHLVPERAAIVLVGDGERIAPGVEALLGPVELVADAAPTAAGPLEEPDEELDPVEDAG